MSDMELIEFSSKAYNDGYFFGFDKEGNGLLDPVIYSPFNPLTKDCDAFSLSAFLKINITYEHSHLGGVEVRVYGDWDDAPEMCRGTFEKVGNSVLRRCITNYAAKIWKETP